jgi:hypothetical protein
MQETLFRGKVLSSEVHDDRCGGGARTLALTPGRTRTILGCLQGNILAGAVKGLKADKSLLLSCVCLDSKEKGI